MDFDCYRPKGMAPETFERLLDDLIAVDGEARQILLAKLHTQDPEMGRAMADLMRRIEDAAARPPLGPLMSTEECLAALSAQEPQADTAPDSGEPPVLDQHDVQELVGEGGMGRVYRARDGALERDVALKVLKQGDGEEGFRREGYVLGQMNHTHIAKIHNLQTGRVGDTSRNVLSMEFVDGLPIHIHCDRSGDTLEQRIRLMIQICAGVEHAHIKGIVHGDLKPGNVLVINPLKTSDSGVAEPTAKIIDFGIARLMSSPQTSAVVYGTLPYLAPEQLEGDGDTRSDVYALGVMLFQLVTGVPFPNWHEISRGGRDAKLDAMRRLSHGKASDYLEAMGESLPEITRDRGVKPHAYIKRVRGDLDLILEKALVKDPESRYQHVHELAADLERFLTTRPISVRSDKLYRAALFFRRNRSMVSGATVAMLLLMSTLVWGVVTKLELIRVDRQRLVYLERQAETLDFFTDLFSEAGVNRGGPLVLLVDVIQFGESVLTRSNADPSIRAAAYLVFGGIVEGMGDLDRAKAYYGSALDFGVLGLEESWKARAGLIRVERGLENYDLAMEMAHNLLADQAKAGAPLEFQMATQLEQANIHNIRDNPVKAAEISREVRNRLSQKLGSDHRVVVLATDILVNALISQGDNKAAHGLLTDGLAVKRDLLGEDHFRVTASIHQLGIVCKRMGGLDEAAQHYEQAWLTRKGTLGENHGLALNSLYGLADVWRAQGALSKAVSGFETVFEQRLKQLGPGHPATLLVQDALACTVGDLGDPSRAVAMLQRADEEFKRSRLKGKRAHLRVKNNLAHYLLEIEQYQRAVHILESVVAEKSKYRDQLAVPLHSLGEAYEKQGCYGPARDLYHQAWDCYLSGKSYNPHKEAEFMGAYARALTASGEREAAKPLLQICLDRLPEGSLADSLHRALATSYGGDAAMAGGL